MCTVQSTVLCFDAFHASLHSARKDRVVGELKRSAKVLAASASYRERDVIERHSDMQPLRWRSYVLRTYVIDTGRALPCSSGNEAFRLKSRRKLEMRVVETKRAECSGGGERAWLKMSLFG